MNISQFDKYSQEFIQKYANFNVDVIKNSRNKVTFALFLTFFIVAHITIFYFIYLRPIFGSGNLEIEIFDKGMASLLSLVIMMEALCFTFVSFYGKALNNTFPNLSMYHFQMIVFGLYSALLIYKGTTNNPLEISIFGVPAGLFIITIYIGWKISKILKLIESPSYIKYPYILMVLYFLVIVKMIPEILTFINNDNIENIINFFTINNRMDLSDALLMFYHYAFPIGFFSAQVLMYFPLRRVFTKYKRIYSEAIHHYNLKEYEIALDSLEGITSMFPNYFEAQYYKIRTLIHLGKQENALIEIEKMICEKSRMALIIEKIAMDKNSKNKRGRLIDYHKQMKNRPIS